MARAEFCLQPQDLSRSEILTRRERILIEASGGDPDKVFSMLEGYSKAVETLAPLLNICGNKSETDLGLLAEEVAGMVLELEDESAQLAARSEELEGKLEQAKESRADVLESTLVAREVLKEILRSFGEEVGEDELLSTIAMRLANSVDALALTPLILRKKAIVKK